MSAPVLALILIAGFFAALTAAAYFRTLDSSLWREARIPVIAGAISGAIIYFATFVPTYVSAGVVLTLAALYVRLMGRESEPADGMTLGTITGAAAAVPLIVFSGERELLRLAECVLAGAVAGYGITFGLTHVRAQGRQALVDAITTMVSIGAAWVPTLLLRGGRATEREIAIGAVAFVPSLLVASVFKQWPLIRAELRHEAALGFLDEEDVRATAHPLRRLGRGGWHDAAAHREFVRIANKIALRKRQQRNRAEDVARLYQLELMKLRMELQEMARIDRAMRVSALEYRHE